MIPLVFMLALALAMIALAWRFGRDPNGLSEVAFYTTPAAFAITPIFVLLPEKNRKNIAGWVDASRDPGD
jgi:hypothetical protein